MKYSELRNLVKSPYFTIQDVRIFGGTIYPSQLTFWKKHALINQLKRGVYIFTDRIAEVSKEELSFILYEPSYISLEYALKRYGFIPDMVYATTSVTTRTTRRLTNTFGSFIYHHVTPRLFFGYSAITTPYGKYLMAEPEKAVLDYLYLHQDVLATTDDIEEMRINPEEFRERINVEKMRTYINAFRSPKVDRLFTLLLSYVHD